MINRFKVAKHFITGIIDDTFTFERDLEKIGAEEKLDGIYVVRIKRRCQPPRYGRDRPRLQGSGRDRVHLPQPQPPKQ